MGDSTKRWNSLTAKDWGTGIALFCNLSQLLKKNHPDIIFHYLVGYRIATYVLCFYPSLGLVDSLSITFTSRSTKKIWIQFSSKNTTLKGTWFLSKNVFVKVVFGLLNSLNSKAIEISMQFLLFSISQLRRYLHELLLDQLPYLSEVQRFLENLSVMEPPPSKQDLIIEQVFISSSPSHSFSLEIHNDYYECLSRIVNKMGK